MILRMATGEQVGALAVGQGGCRTQTALPALGGPSMGGEGGCRLPAAVVMELFGAVPPSSAEATGAPPAEGSAAGAAPGRDSGQAPPAEQVRETWPRTASPSTGRGVLGLEGDSGMNEQPISPPSSGGHCGFSRMTRARCGRRTCASSPNSALWRISGRECPLGGHTHCAPSGDVLLGGSEPEAPILTCFCVSIQHRLYSHIQLASKLTAGCDYSLFKVQYPILRTPPALWGHTGCW